MFKITLENTWCKNGIPTNYIKYLKVNTIQEVWCKNGIPTNYIKYLKVNTIQEVFNFYKLDDIVKVEEC